MPMLLVPLAAAYRRSWDVIKPYGEGEVGRGVCVYVYSSFPLNALPIFSSIHKLLTHQADDKLQQKYTFQCKFVMLAIRKPDCAF